MPYGSSAVPQLLADRHSIIAMYEGGERLEKMARRYRTARLTLAKLLDRWGVPRIRKERALVSWSRPLPQPRATLRAYFAGLFDGEGSVGSSFHKRDSQCYYKGTDQARMVVHVALTNTARDCIDLLVHCYGGRCCHGHAPNGRPTYIWYPGGMPRAVWFLGDIEPYVVIKRPQVTAALVYADTVKWPKARSSTLTADVLDIRPIAWRAIRQANVLSRWRKVG